MDKMTISLFFRLCYTALINHVKYRYYGKAPAVQSIYNIFAGISG